MSIAFKTTAEKNFAEKTLLITREFAAPVHLVWRAFTEHELLDKWWGPSPWRAETKRMDFKVGGSWLYAMVGPEGERHWGCMEYTAIDPQHSFGYTDVFCDENGIANDSLPAGSGVTLFKPTANGTIVEMSSAYATEEALKLVLEMGIEAGLSVCFDQLDILLKPDGLAAQN